MSTSHAEELALALHALSHPLTTLRGILELELLKREDQRQPHEAMQQALAQADEAVRIFQSVRDIVELEAEPAGATRTGPWSRLDLALCDAVAELAPEAAARAVHLGLGLLAEPVCIPLSASRLATALHKLLSSLLQCCPSGSHITAAAGLQEGRACAVFSVEPALENAARRLAHPLAARRLETRASSEGVWDALVAHKIFERAGGSIEVSTARLSETQLVVSFPPGGWSNEPH